VHAVLVPPAAAATNRRSLRSAGFGYIEGADRSTNLYTGESSMNIAIIGAGNVGKALGSSSVRAGHSVVFAAKHPDHARAAAEQTGGRAASSSREAAEAAEVIVLAVPYPALDAVLAGLGDALAGKVVVDATNPLNAEYSGLAVEGTSAAEEIQRKAGAARVVKAFNTVFAARQADPVVDGAPVDGFVAADDEDAKAQVLELARSIGMRPIDVGGLPMARALEQMAFLNISLQLRNGWPWQSAWKLAGPTS
jgi:NADPH-dependent F420 reductase